VRKVSEGVCVCVCEGERERERERERKRERGNESVRACVCLRVCVCENQDKFAVPRDKRKNCCREGERERREKEEKQKDRGDLLKGLVRCIIRLSSLCPSTPVILSPISSLYLFLLPFLSPLPSFFLLRSWSMIPKKQRQQKGRASKEEGREREGMKGRASKEGHIHATDPPD